MSESPQLGPVPADPPPAGPEQHLPAQVRTPREPVGSGTLAAVQSLSVTVVIAVFVVTFLLQAFQIPSESMENTLLIGDYLLVDKVRYGSGGYWGHILPYEPVKRGEIIVFRYPVHPVQHFVKRVIGIPGDHVRMIDKRVYVNGQPLSEDYAVYHAAGPDSYRDDFPAPELATSSVEARWWLQMQTLVRNHELIVPPNRYFVLGDNRDESLDSRYWGLVPRENIIGRPLIIYWSVGQPALADRGGADDTLSRFTYVLTHLFRLTRWDRTFRVVR